MLFKPLSGRTLIPLLAGFALNIISSPVNGLIPLRALRAGFFTTLIFNRPGRLKYPAPRGFNSLAIIFSRASNTDETSLRERSVSPEMKFKISDFVGGFLTDELFVAAMHKSSNSIMNSNKVRQYDQTL